MNNLHDSSRYEVRSGFSLAELLVVVAIVSLMSVAAIPAIRSLAGAGAVNKAITEMSGTIESARGYAMSRHTYVRLAIGRVEAAGARVNPVLVVLVIAPKDGTLDADSQSDLQDPTKWVALSRPLLMDNLAVADNLSVNSAFGSATDDKPSGASANGLSNFSRPISGLGTVAFTSFIQFSPTGEMGISKAEPSRFIQLGVDRPAPQNGKNPFVLRISGCNGTVSILRKGSGIN